MPNILATTTVPAGTTSAPVNVDNTTNIIVGVKGRGYIIHYTLGSTLSYIAGTGDKVGPSDGTVLVSKAFEISVESTGIKDIQIEMFA